MVEMVLNLLGREGEEELPPCAIYLVDAGKRIEKRLASVEDTKAEIDASIEKEPVIPWDFGG